MKELVRALLDQPRLISQISAEHITNEKDKIIFQAMQALAVREMVPNLAGLSHLLESYNRSDIVEHLKQRAAIDNPYGSEYVMALLKDNFNRQLLFSLYNDGLRNLSSMSAEENKSNFLKEIKRWASAVSAKPINDVVESTMRLIEDIQDGKSKAYWQTGWEPFDELVGMGKRQIIVSAAQKKIGKTRWTVALANNLLNRNPELTISWFDFEMSSVEMVACQIANELSIDTQRILGKKKPLLSSEERIMIREYTPRLKARPINYFTTKSTVEQITEKVLEMKDQNKGGDHLVIIDNFGLVRPSSGISGETAQDDHVARSLKELRDESDACIYIIHHLSKSSEGPFNKKDFYRPKATDVRGSSRIVDFANTLLLHHRLDKYKDLEQMMDPVRWAEAQGLYNIIVELNRSGGEDEIIFRHRLAQCQFDLL